LCACLFVRAQKCSRFHPLSEFDGGRRTCARLLSLQNARRREKMARKADEEALAEAAGGSAEHGAGVGAAVTPAAAVSAALTTSSAGAGVSGSDTGGAAAAVRSAERTPLPALQLLQPLPLPPLFAAAAAAASSGTGAGAGASGSAAAPPAPAFGFPGAPSQGEVAHLEAWLTACNPFDDLLRGGEGGVDDFAAALLEEATRAHAVATARGVPAAAQQARPWAMPPLPVPPPPLPPLPASSSALYGLAAPALPRHVTLQLKLHNVLPNVLPPGLAAELSAWLGAPLLAQHGLITPGCTVLTVDTLLCGGGAGAGEEAPRDGCAPGSALGLAAALGCGAAGALLRRCGASLWVEGCSEGARFVAGAHGAAQRIAPPHAPQAELPPLAPRALHIGGDAAEVVLISAAACAAGGAVTARCAGRALCSGAAVATATAGAPLRVSLPAAAVACEGCLLLSYAAAADGSAPPPTTRAVLLTRDADIAAEVANALCSGCDAATAEALVRGIGAALAPGARRGALLFAAHAAAQRSWPALLARMLAALAAAPEDDDDDDAAAGESASHGAGAVTLLHRAAASGDASRVGAVLCAGAPRGRRYAPARLGDACALGPGGVTPLHLAACFADGGAAGALCDASPAAALAWFAARDAAQRTPAHLARDAGGPQLRALHARLAGSLAAAAAAAAAARAAAASAPPRRRAAAASAFLSAAATPTRELSLRLLAGAAAAESRATSSAASASAQRERAYCAWLAAQNAPLCRTIAAFEVFHCVALLFHAARRVLLPRAPPAVLPPMLAALAAAAPLYDPTRAAPCDTPELATALPWASLQRAAAAIAALTLFTRLPAALFMLWAASARAARPLWAARHEAIFSVCGLVETGQSLVAELIILATTGRVLQWPLALTLVYALAMPIFHVLGPCRPRWNAVVWALKAAQVPGLLAWWPALCPLLRRDVGVRMHAAATLACVLTARANDRRLRRKHAATLARADKKLS
jgi:hypothetical protein